MHDSDGRISLWIGADTEIHDQKETEVELRRANEDLNQFAYAASHDLQEPLRMITAYSQLLLKGYRGQLEGEPALCVNFVNEGTKRMRDLLAALLAYSQVGADGDRSMKVTDLNLVFNRAVENCQAAIAETGATVTSDPLPAVRGHEEHFVQLLQNLIGNAVKYHGPRPPAIHVAAEKCGEEWRIAVTDNGMGIAPEYHQTIFGVFKRLHAKDIPGTGIGLAICRRVVERYGGRIWVESEAGQGAKFLFTLPVANGATDVQ
jgi:light-regulated signal transduction histidine kinase (bacteriophytochrome)